MYDMGHTMTMKGKIPWNKGKKTPHSKEWEDKRIAAVREAAKHRVYSKGYRRPESAIKPMQDALVTAQVANPERFRKQSIANLPKRTSNEVTKKARLFRSKESGRFKAWRKTILARDNNRCRECGSTIRLEAHHIIPITESTETAFLSMNGIILCRNCHKQTDTYAGAVDKRLCAWLRELPWRRSLGAEQMLGRTTLISRVIPHKHQIYETVGNYAWTEEGVLVIFISDMHNDLYERLVLTHELIEAVLVRDRKISCADIDAFDITYEANRPDGDDSEPGHDPTAPYHKEHVFAERIERLLAAELGINWDTYDKAVLSLSQD